MPDNESPGEIKNFISQLIPNNDPMWPLAEQYIDNIPTDTRSSEILRNSERRFMHGLLPAKIPTEWELLSGHVI
ncbi:MAG: hypothetical protein OXF84_09015 [Bacteroidetes bacterium]|nr:hypothetical protein [Bacteroidota bacterium]